MQEFFVDDGQKHTIRRDGKKYYLTVCETGMMFSGPGESSFQYQEKFEAINLICRLASKARENGVAWKHILKQFDSVNVTGRPSIISDIADRIRNTDFEKISKKKPGD